jgi:hypothetical protein
MLICTPGNQTCRSSDGLSLASTKPSKRINSRLAWLYSDFSFCLSAMGTFLSCALGAHAAFASSTSTFCPESCALCDRCCCLSISLGKCQSVGENASRCSSRAKAWNACLISRCYVSEYDQTQEISNLVLTWVEFDVVEAVLVRTPSKFHP